MEKSSPFDSRRIKLGFQHSAKLKTYPSIPAYSYDYDTIYENTQENQQNKFNHMS